MNQERFRLLATIATIAIVAIYGVVIRADRSFNASAQGDAGNDVSPSSAEQRQEGSGEQRLPVPLQFAAGNDRLPTTPEGFNLSSIRIAGSTLRPRENDVDYRVGADGGCIYASSGDSSTVWNTPIWLPAGATVHSVRLYYYDASAENSVGWFTIYDLYGNVVNEWSVTSAGSSGNGYQDSAVINHPIEYSVYGYALNWQPEAIGEAIQLCGFRIFYESPLFPFAFLPTISK